MNQQNKIHGAVTDYRFSVSQVPAEVKRCASTRRKDLTSNKYGVSAGSPSDLGSWAVWRFSGLPNGLWRSWFLQLFPLLQSLAFGGWSVVGVQCLWRRCCWRPEVGVLSSWVQCCEVGVWFAGDGLASLMGVWFFWWLYDLRWLIWVVLRGDGDPGLVPMQPAMLQSFLVSVTYGGFTAVFGASRWWRLWSPDFRFSL